MNLEKLEKFLKNNNQPTYRLEQIKKAVYKNGVSSFAEITNTPLDLRKRLEKDVQILSFETEKIFISNDKLSAKALLKLSDGNNIETVLISPKPDTWSACVSTQVGCSIGCAFCATGQMGFKRNLTAEEITDQVLFWRQYLKNNFRSIENCKLKIKNFDVSNIVYMGMGEPFLNWESVRKSLQDLTNKDLFDFGSRSISVSTAGVPEGISKFVQEFPQINLAVSLHFTNDEKRSHYMSINRKYNLNELKKALQKYFNICKRKVFIEYILLKEINDDKKSAQELVSYLKSIGPVHLLHVNLITYNSHNMEHRTWNNLELKASSKTAIQEFKNYLLQNKINATIRKSLGQEISGACGQLAGKIT